VGAADGASPRRSPPLGAEESYATISATSSSTPSTRKAVDVAPLNLSGGASPSRCRPIPAGTGTGLSTTPDHQEIAVVEANGDAIYVGAFMGPESRDQPGGIAERLLVIAPRQRCEPRR
jgi:hypothetical protein